MLREEVVKIIKDKTPIEKIISVDNFRNMWEVVGKVGGDVLRYRVYSNGEIVEK